MIRPLFLKPLFYSMCLSLFLWPDFALAQRHAGYCDGSRTTADALACVNEHKSDVQTRLNTIFDEATKQSDSRTQPLLTKAQNAWISYRDAQCAWEAALAANPSLERIYELSCVTLLTGLRTDLLATILETENNDQPREFGATPRWMNVLIQDHADVFWKFGRWQHANLDCTGPEEQAVLGIRFVDKKNKDKNRDENSRAQTAEVVLALARNPLIGKPATGLVTIPLRHGDGKDKEGLYVCGTDITLSRVPYASTGHETQGGDGNSSCQAIKIDDGKCDPVYLYWKNGQYGMNRDLTKLIQNDRPIEK